MHSPDFFHIHRKEKEFTHAVFALLILATLAVLYIALLFHLFTK